MAPEEVGPSVTPPAVGRLHWVLIPGRRVPLQQQDPAGECYEL